MMGAFTDRQEFKKARVKKLHGKGLRPSIIAERLGLTLNQVHSYLDNLGLKEKANEKSLLCP